MTNAGDVTVRANGVKRRPQAADGQDPSSNQLPFDAAAIASSLKAGDSLEISVDNGVLKATKTGPSAYNNFLGAVAGGGGAFLSAAVGTADSLMGTDPTLSIIQASQTMFTQFQNFSLIPAPFSTLFSDKFFPAFRLLAPVLDGLKLMNTIKTSQAKVAIHTAEVAAETKRALAKGQAAPPPAPTGILAHMKVGDLISIGIEGLHLGINLVCAASVAAALVPALGGLALMALPVACGVGLASDIAAAVYHSLGTIMAVNDPRNGAGIAERVHRFVSTQALSAVIRRVVRGQEPLLTAPPEVDPNKGPAQPSADDPAGDNGARPPDTQPPPDPNNGPQQGPGGSQSVPI